MIQRLFGDPEKWTWFAGLKFSLFLSTVYLVASAAITIGFHYAHFDYYGPDEQVVSIWRRVLFIWTIICSALVISGATKCPEKLMGPITLIYSLSVLIVVLLGFYYISVFVARMV